MGKRIQGVQHDPRFQTPTEGSRNISSVDKGGLSPFRDLLAGDATRQRPCFSRDQHIFILFAITGIQRNATAIKIKMELHYF